MKQCFGRTQPITYKQLCCLFRFPWRWHISHHAGLLHGLLRCAPPSWSYTLGVGGRAGTFSFGSSFYNQMVKWCIILAFSLHVRSPYETSHPCFHPTFTLNHGFTSNLRESFKSLYYFHLMVVSIRPSHQFWFFIWWLYHTHTIWNNVYDLLALRTSFIHCCNRCPQKQSEFSSSSAFAVARYSLRWHLGAKKGWMRW